MCPAVDTASRHTHITFWTACAILVLCIALLLALALVSKVRLRKPNLEAWLGGAEQALESPQVAAIVR